MKLLVNLKLFKNKRLFKKERRKEGGKEGSLLQSAWAGGVEEVGDSKVPHKFEDRDPF